MMIINHSINKIFYALLKHILTFRSIRIMIQRLHVESAKTSTNGQNKEDLSLDLEYLAIRRQIFQSNFYQFASKHIKIRLQGWIGKLDSVITNSIWKRNRNNYAKLINLVCECEVIVQPFTSLPFQGDLPKLSKHTINSIIDAVERAIKNESKLTKNSSSNSRNGEYQRYHSSKNRQSYQQEEAEWSSFKEEESSFLKGRFTNTAELSHGQISFDARNGQFLSVVQQIRSLNQSKDICFSNKKPKNNTQIEMINSRNEAKLKSKELKHPPPPKHIVVKLNPVPPRQKDTSYNHSEDSQKCPSNFSSSYNVIEAEQSSSHGLSDGNQLQNYTLNTEMFDQDISQPPIQDQQFDFSGQISERCQNKDQILKIQYFVWKQKSEKVPSTEPKSSSFGKHNIKFSQSIPAKILLSELSSMNASARLESKKRSVCESAGQFFQANHQKDNTFEDQDQKQNYLADITDNFHNLE